MVELVELVELGKIVLLRHSDFKVAKNNFSLKRHQGFEPQQRYKAVIFFTECQSRSDNDFFMIKMALYEIKTRNLHFKINKF